MTRTFYKYCSKNRISVLKDGLIRFTQPSDFNDPFEFLPSSFDEGDVYSKIYRKHKGMIRDELVDYLNKLNQSEKSSLVAENNSNDFKEASGKIMERFDNWESDFSTLSYDSNRDDFLMSIASSLREIADLEAGVLSLSMNPDSLLMWGHYCESHTGFMLHLDGDHDFFRESRPVIYRSSRLVEIKEMIDFSYTKSSEWAYEQEWRLIKPLKDSHEKLPGDDPDLDIHLFQIPAESIIAVTLGINASDKLKDEVVKHSGLNNFKVYDTSIQDGAFSFIYRLL